MEWEARSETERDLILAIKVMEFACGGSLIRQCHIDYCSFNLQLFFTYKFANWKFQR